jgi:TrpR-related protein YerC/YecD
MTNLNEPKIQNLFRAMLALKTTGEAADFCRDLMTLPEITEFADRLEIARKLSEGNPQRKVAAQTGVSVATVTRVNQWLRRGMGGYTLILDRLNSAKKISHHKQLKLASGS